MADGSATKEHLIRLPRRTQPKCLIVVREMLPYSIDLLMRLVNDGAQRISSLVYWSWIGRC